MNRMVFALASVLFVQAYSSIVHAEAPVEAAQTLDRKNLPQPGADQKAKMQRIEGGVIGRGDAAERRLKLQRGAAPQASPSDSPDSAAGN